MKNNEFTLPGLMYVLSQFLTKEPKDCTDRTSEEAIAKLESLAYTDWALIRNHDATSLLLAYLFLSVLVASFLTFKCFQSLFALKSFSL